MLSSASLETSYGIQHRTSSRYFYSKGKCYAFILALIIGLGAIAFELGFFAHSPTAHTFIIHLGVIVLPTLLIMISLCKKKRETLPSLDTKSSYRITHDSPPVSDQRSMTHTLVSPHQKSVTIQTHNYEITLIGDITLLNAPPTDDSLFSFTPIELDTSTPYFFIKDVVLDARIPTQVYKPIDIKKYGYSLASVASRGVKKIIYNECSLSPAMGTSTHRKSAQLIEVTQDGREQRLIYVDGCIMPINPLSSERALCALHSFLFAQENFDFNPEFAAFCPDLGVITIFEQSRSSYGPNSWYFIYFNFDETIITHIKQSNFDVFVNIKGEHFKSLAAHAGNFTMHAVIHKPLDGLPYVTGNIFGYSLQSLDISKVSANLKVSFEGLIPVEEIRDLIINYAKAFFIKKD